MPPCSATLSVRIYTSSQPISDLAHPGVVFSLYPDLAAIYKRIEAGLNVPNALRMSTSFNLPFAAHTLNLGPYVRCWFHRDSRNFILGICPVVAFGDFNHETSGHFIMVEPRIVLEFRPGDVLLMMSAIITHGTAPLRRGETRMSWTCFTAGGLFRWHAAEGRLVSELTEQEHAGYLKRSEDLFAEAWHALHTLEELRDLADGKLRAEK